MFIGAIGAGVVAKKYFDIFERFSLFLATTFNAVLGFYLFKAYNYQINETVTQ